MNNDSIKLRDYMIEHIFERIILYIIKNDEVKLNINIILPKYSQNDIINDLKNKLECFINGTK